MGFLGLFGKKEKTPTTIETTLELLPTLIEKNFQAKKQELEMATTKKISEIKYLHSKSLKLLQDIKSQDIEEKGNKRFNKAAFTSKQQIEKQLEKLLLKMNPVDRGNTLEDVKAFSGEGNAILVNEIMSFRKNIIYTSAYLKDEMKALGEALQGMLNNFSELEKLLADGHEIFEFEKIKEKINSSKSEDIKLVELNQKVKNLEEEITKKESEIQTQKENLEKILNGDTANGLKKLEEEKSALVSEKQKLKLEVSSLLSTVDRPLQRFNSLVSSGRWILAKENQNILSGILTNPMLTLKKDPKGEKFKEILTEVVKAIKDGQIELKDREREKRLNALNELLTFNFFEKVFWKLNEIQKKQTALETELSLNTTQKEINNQENVIKQLNNQKESLFEQIKKLKLDLGDYSSKIKKENTEILDFSEKLLGKKIILKSG